MTVTGSPLGSTTKPIGLLVTIDREEAVHAWTRQDDGLHPLPDLGYGPALVVVTLAADGKSVLFSCAELEDDDGRPQGDRVRHLGAFRWSFAQHRADPVGFPVMASTEQAAVLVTDPQGGRLARLLTWRDAPPGAPLSMDDWKSSVQVIGASGQVRELVSWRGQASGMDGDNQRFQWSPRGDLLAVEWTATPGAIETALIDSASGAVVAQIPASIVGSASFSPDGSRLLVSQDAVAHLYNLETGGMTPIPLVPGRQGYQESRSGTPRLLGFADDDHLLLVTQRGKTITLARGRIDGNELQPLLRWTGGDDMYVTICRPTPAFWMF